MTTDEAVNIFLNDYILPGKIVKMHPEVNKEELLRKIKDLGIANNKDYILNNIHKKYERIFQEYSTTNIGLNEICRRENVGRRNINLYMENRDLFVDDLKDQECITTKTLYSCNENVFNFIDNPEKAYWLGFLYADGYNSGRYVQLTISYHDFNHLKKFRRFMQSTHCIRYRKTDHTVNITIVSKKLSNALTRLGCVRGKTYSANFPALHNLRHIYYRDFIRGFFDGDGCIRKIEYNDVTCSNSIVRKTYKVSFTVKMLHFAEQLKKAIEHIVAGIEVKIYHLCDKVYSDKIYDQYEVYIQGEFWIRAFLDTLYRDTNIYMDRKYKRYLLYILPSDLEIDQIINAKLSGNVLPDLYPQEEEISRIIRTEGVQYELDYGNIVDRRKSSQGQSVEDETVKSV